MYTSGAVKDWSHNGTIEFMTAGMNSSDRESLMSMPNLSGSIIGFDSTNNDVIDKIFEPWRKCCWEKNCIAPDGADKT